MAHVHSLTIFDVDRIEIEFDDKCNSYRLMLVTAETERTTQINVWRSATGKRADLIVEGVDFTAKESAT